MSEDALQKRVGQLEDALTTMIRVAGEAAKAWENDQDHRAGKMLLAMSGQMRGYRLDVDEALAARRPLSSKQFQPHEPWKSGPVTIGPEASNAASVSPMFAQVKETGRSSSEHPNQANTGKAVEADQPAVAPTAPDPYEQAAIELETLPGGGPASVEKMVVQAGLEPHAFKIMQALLFGAYQELSDAIRQRDAFQQAVAELMPLTPQWEHDRDCCVFLGRMETADLYWCWQSGWPTFIERYGPEGSEYRSMPWQALRQWETQKGEVAVRGCWEAYERAKKRNLPLDNVWRKEEPAPDPMAEVQLTPEEGAELRAVLDQPAEPLPVEAVLLPELKYTACHNAHWSIGSWTVSDNQGHYIARFFNDGQRRAEEYAAFLNGKEAASSAPQ